MKALDCLGRFLSGERRIFGWPGLGWGYVGVGLDWIGCVVVWVSYDYGRAEKREN